MFRALHKGKTVGANLVFVHDKTGYTHLSAYSDSGYKLRASCALYWRKIEYFADKLRWFVLGGGSGVDNDATDGLSRFKAGWSTGTRPVYFCGRIFDPQKYAKIVKARHTLAANYFPAYRLGEFS